MNYSAYYTQQQGIGPELATSRKARREKMAIFTATDIKRNWLYAPVMEEINELHDEMGAPEAPSGGPVANGELEAHWESDAIGDWRGDEESVAEWANDRREEVLDALNMGPSPYYHQSDEWSGFANQAYNLVREFEAYDAFERLCSEWDNHQ
jgi:hypothetical protein